MKKSQLAGKISPEGATGNKVYSRSRNWQFVSLMTSD